MPVLAGHTAAIITGIVVGVSGTTLTALAMMDRKAVQGTSSCGRPGFFLVLAVLALMILLGALLLGWQIRDSGRTSFLAVAIVTVVVLLILIEVAFSPWMFVVIPVVSALSFALSHWVTTRFIDEPLRADAARKEVRGVDVR